MSAYTQNFVYRVGERKNLKTDPSVISTERLNVIKKAAGEYPPDQKQQWYKCPHCGKPLFPIRPDTKIQNMSFRCKACKHDIEINI